MTKDDQLLVIHAGELIPVDQARVLMMEEFPAHGYPEDVIEGFLQRAYKATQAFLEDLDHALPGYRKQALEDALRRDAQAAAKWRAYWKANPDKDYQGYQTEKAERQAQAQRDFEEQQKERQKKWEAAREEQERERIANQERKRIAEEERRKRYAEEQALELERIRKAQWNAEFRRWQCLNETGGRDAGAERRAEERKARDDWMWQTILHRIDQISRNPPLTKGATQEAYLNLLTDQEYIAWMFHCFAHRCEAVPV